MKVLHVNEHLERKGGVETYLLALLPMLEERGVEAVAAYDGGDGTAWKAATQVPGLGTARFSADRPVRAALADVLARERPDVVHVHNVSNVGALAACLDYGATVMTTHDYRTVCPASNFFYKRTQEVCGRTCGPGCFTTTLRKHCLTPRPRYAAYFYRRATWATRQAGRLAAVIAPSGDTKARLTRSGFDAGRIIVLPYFCPVEPAAEPRATPPAPTLTYMGRIASNKGHEYFVQALGALPERVRGIMVGNLAGEAGEAVRRLAQEAGCADRLELHAWASREEVRRILDRTTVLLFPSLWPETLGIVGLEALARGVPVVASDLGGVREWLREGENGFLVPPKGTAEIRDAVLRIVDSEETLRAFGACGIETIRDRFLPGRHVDGLLACYDEVAGRRA